MSCATARAGRRGSSGPPKIEGGSDGCCAARAPRRALSGERAQVPLPETVALAGHEEAVALRAACDADAAGRAGEGPAMPPVSVGECPVGDVEAGCTARAEEARLAAGGELEAVPVARFAAPLERHAVVGMVEPTDQRRRMAGGVEAVRVVEALDVPRRRAEAGQDAGAAGRRRGRKDRGDEDRGGGGDDQRCLHGSSYSITPILGGRCNAAVTGTYRSRYAATARERNPARACRPGLGLRPRACGRRSGTARSARDPEVLRRGLPSPRSSRSGRSRRRAAGPGT